MLPEKRQKQELSTQQKTFINFLFGEAEGNPKKAGELAGYAPSSYPKVVKALKKASKAHAGQAKVLKGVINGGSKKRNG